jgi:hypothetical protein
MGNGQPAGVSAQQLAGTRLGGLVRPGPDGLLRVDAGGAATTALAASADQEHRLRALEMQVAQSDPRQSPYAEELGEQGYDNEYAEGQQREREAARLSNEIAAARGLGAVQVDTPRDPFAGAPQMQRGGFDRGNIDLYRQPQVRNPDGSISTVDSSSYNIGGREMLLPSVTPDGRHLASDADIVGEYERTGRHLGSFSSPEAASSYARELHDAYASGAFDTAPAGHRMYRETPSPFGPEPVERTGLGARAPARRRRRPGLVQVEEGGGKTPTVTPVADELANYDRRAPIEPYRPGSARTLDYNTMVGRPRQAPLDPASQQMLDSAHDYLNEYTMEVRDEAGNVRRVMIPAALRERLGTPVPVDLQRQMDQLARDDEARAIEDERSRRAALPPMRRAI